MMHNCVSCGESLKLDQTLIDRYPEWRTLTTKPANKLTISKRQHQQQQQFQMIQSGASDYSQISSSGFGGGGGFSSGGGNLGHSTAMIGNLFDIICEDRAAIDHPMCQECADKLLDCTDQQLRQLEEDCKEYKKLLDTLQQPQQPQQKKKTTTETETDNLDNLDHLDLSSLKSELLKLQGEEAGLQSELARLESEEEDLEKRLLDEEDGLRKITDEEEHLWTTYRDLSRQLQEFSAEEQSVRNQLRYSNGQLERLKTANVFNLTFHIWHSGHFGTINGFRLGRLPNEVVEWSEINAAWGQTVLLLYSLARKVNLKFNRYELVPFGSHSYIRSCPSSMMEDSSSSASATTNTNKELPLFCSGGYKFFWDTKFDSAMVAFLDCLQQFKEEIDKFGEIRLPYRMSKDKIEDNGSEFSVKIQFNSEERWTKAMKCMLTNLKWALACVSSLHS